MKRFTLILIFIIFCLQGVATETIRIATAEWKPFISESLKHNGVYTHIITEAFALVNIEVEIGFFPWPRAEAFTKTGEWDAMATLVSTPEREKVFYIMPVGK